MTRCFRVCPFTRKGQLQVAARVWGSPRGRTVATLLTGVLKLFIHDHAGLDRVLASSSFVAHAPVHQAPVVTHAAHAQEPAASNMAVATSGLYRDRTSLLDPHFSSQQNPEVQAVERIQEQIGETNKVMCPPQIQQQGGEAVQIPFTGTKLMTNRGADWKQACSSDDY